MRIFKLFGLGAALVVLTLAVANSSVVSWGAGMQPIPSKGTVFITQVQPSPGGAIFQVTDLAAGSVKAIVRRLSWPFDILCGPDGRLYITEDYAYEGSDAVSRIVRFNQDGKGRVVIAQWPAAEKRAAGLTFAPNGDLYFGTISRAEGERHKGIWRIRGVLQAEDNFNAPEQVLPEAVFTRTPTRYDSVKPRFLTVGPYQGDLLIIDSPSFSGDRGGQVLRAPQSDLTNLVKFIAAHDNPRPFQPSDIDITSQGELLVSDSANDKIVRYAADGVRIGLFAKVDRAMQMAIGPDETIYVTGYVSSQSGRLSALTPDGKEVASFQFSFRLYDVAVCAPTAGQ